MDISDTRKCNLFNIEMLARYIGAPEQLSSDFYEELLNDRDFLNSTNKRIAEIRGKWGFNKGIFAMPTINSIDWFAFERVLIYVLIRYLKPKRVLETGVYYGGNTAFTLQALARNQEGKLVSLDYPDSEIHLKGSSEARHSLVGDSELYESRLRPGFMVPLSLYQHWELIEGDSLKLIPDLQYAFDL